MTNRKDGLEQPNNTASAKEADQISMSAITPLEKKIFFSIMNNMQLIHKENEEFLITYLPHPLCDIVKKLQEEKNKEPKVGFIQFFEALGGKEQQYVSKILLESGEEISPGLFEQLLIRLQKKHWKLIVNGIKIKLEAARSANDTQEINAIMHNFAHLKKKIIGSILPE